MLLETVYGRRGGPRRGRKTELLKISCGGGLGNPIRRNEVFQIGILSGRIAVHVPVVPTSRCADGLVFCTQAPRSAWPESPRDRCGRAKTSGPVKTNGATPQRSNKWTRNDMSMYKASRGKNQTLRAKNGQEQKDARPFFCMNV